MKPNIMIVDDSLMARKSFSNIFHEFYNILEVDSGYSALNILAEEEQKVDLILLDLIMPGINGLEVLKYIKSNKKFDKLPIVVISSDEKQQLAALNAGAWDFVSKVENKEIIKARIKNVLARRRIEEVENENRMINEMLKNVLHYSNDVVFQLDLEKNILNYYGSFSREKIENIKNSVENFKPEEFIYSDDIYLFNKLKKKVISGENNLNSDIRIKVRENMYVWCQMVVTGIKDKEGKVKKIFGKLSDIHEYKKAVTEAIHISNIDPLTKLLNRRAFEEYIEKNMLNKNITNAYIIIDVDNFKNVNDTYGHANGDIILKKISEILLETFHEKDFIARIGGDEFAIFAVDIKDEEYLKKKLERLRELTKNPIDISSGEKYIQTISVGCYIIPKYSELDLEYIFDKTDKALYETKENGKNGYTISNY
ncbi:diguanylate cyclase domain-containing protein [Fusobacterium sp. MFO224]|uniref:GGDEF domain-containing response regulator n=1 Tax=Fusobacterium sp. MFO224 TaxID=3378070 RepID=UPI003853578F